LGQRSRRVGELDLPSGVGARVREKFWLDDGERWRRLGGLRALLGRDSGWECEAEEVGVGTGWGVRRLDYHRSYFFSYFLFLSLSLRG